MFKKLFNRKRKVREMDEEEDLLPSIPSDPDEILAQVYAMSPEMRKYIWDRAMAIQIMNPLGTGPSYLKVSHIVAAISVVNMAAELVGEEGLPLVASAFIGQPSAVSED